MTVRPTGRAARPRPDMLAASERAPPSAIGQRFRRYSRWSLQVRASSESGSPTPKQINALRLNPEFYKNIPCGSRRQACAPALRSHHRRQCRFHPRGAGGFLVSGSAAASDKSQTIFLRLVCLIRGRPYLGNLDESSFSEGIVQTVRIAADDGQTPAACDPDPARTKAFAQARALSPETRILGAKECHCNRARPV